MEAGVRPKSTTPIGSGELCVKIISLPTNTSTRSREPGFGLSRGLCNARGPT